jgi:hypothetical protein
VHQKWVFVVSMVCVMLFVCLNKLCVLVVYLFSRYFLFIWLNKLHCLCVWLYILEQVVPLVNSVHCKINNNKINKIKSLDPSTNRVYNPNLTRMNLSLPRWRWWWRIEGSCCRGSWNGSKMGYSSLGLLCSVLQCVAAVVNVFTSPPLHKIWSIW